MEENSDVIKLPQIPKNRGYEDYVAAILNAGGYFLERGIKMREEGDILELDIVVNKFEKDNEVQKSIIEVKSGKEWGFPEIFKVKGWMSFLGFDKAAFVVQVVHNKILDLYSRISDKLDISLIITPEKGEKLEDTMLKKYYAIIPCDNYDVAVSCLRFAFALEHKLTDDIISATKSNAEISSYADLRNYLEIINDNSFFDSDAKSRLRKIFEAYQQYRNMTARIDQEKSGKAYCLLTNDERIRKETYDSLFYKCTDMNILYASLFVELLEKLNILKCCVEDLLRPAGKKSMFESLGDDLLPSTLKDGMKVIKEQPYYHLYPYFWQMFIFLFGGFFINDKENKAREYALLSDITKVPQEHIDDALGAFDLLFPIPDGKKWLFEIPKSSVSMLMFVPVPFCGIGVNFRRAVYSKDGSFESLKKELPTGDMTYHDFVKWNNLAASYLMKSKDVIK